LSFGVEFWDFGWKVCNFESEMMKGKGVLIYERKDKDLSEKGVWLRPSFSFDFWV
jgi:hypothetical protein